MYKQIGNYLYELSQVGWTCCGKIVQEIDGPLIQWFA